MRVSEIMTTNVISVKPETKITEAAALLLQNHINGLPVLDEEEKVVGIICQSDLISQQKQLPLPTVFTLFDGLIPLQSMHQMEKEVQKISATEVSQAMTPKPTCIAPEKDIEELADLMVNKNFHTIPVVSEEKLVGIVGKEDVLKTLLPKT
jgi:CBS-domain-containing membrane protein